MKDWKTEFLSTTEQEKISQAIKKAEKKTSVEIVPLVVRKSSSTQHVFLFLLLFVLSITLTFEAWLGPIAAGISFVVSLLLALFLNRYDFIHRWLTPASELNSQTMMRAEAEFWRQGLHKTQGATGVLIFVSLFERKAIILGDASVSEHFKEEDWSEAVQVLLENIGRYDPAEGFCLAIAKILAVVKTEFPPSKKSNKNELPDGVIFKD